MPTVFRNIPLLSRSGLGCEFGEAVGDLAGYAAELGEAVRFVADSGGGVFEAPVNAARLDREHGAAFFGVIAHGDHVVEGPAGEAIDVLGPVAADIDAELRHHGDGLRPDTAGAGTGGVYLHAIAGHVAKQSLRHLAAGGVRSE